MGPNEPSELEMAAYLLCIVAGVVLVLGWIFDWSGRTELIVFGTIVGLWLITVVYLNIADRFGR